VDIKRREGRWREKRGERRDRDRREIEEKTERMRR
jgi:hypothetical protein